MAELTTKHIYDRIETIIRDAMLVGDAIGLETGQQPFQFEKQEEEFIEDMVGYFIGKCAPRKALLAKKVLSKIANSL